MEIVYDGVQTACIDGGRHSFNMWLQDPERIVCEGCGLTVEV